MVEVDPEHFAQWEAAEQRVVQLQGELTRSKKTNTVTSTQPSKTIHEAFATYGNHAQDAPQALPREQLQQLVRALKEASKGPDTSGPSPTESSQAALQSQIDNLTKCVLENRVVVESVHTRLLKLEGRVEEMDMAKGKAVRNSSPSYATQMLILCRSLKTCVKSSRLLRLPSMSSATVSSMSKQLAKAKRPRRTKEQLQPLRRSLSSTEVGAIY